MRVFVERTKDNRWTFCSPSDRHDTCVDRHTSVQTRAHYFGSMAVKWKYSRRLMLNSSGNANMWPWWLMLGCEAQLYAAMLKTCIGQDRHHRTVTVLLVVIKLVLASKLLSSR